jgi:cobalt/nickel transport system permease protein
MHIPDGFLDLPAATATTALAATGVGIALWQTKRTLPARRVPLLGVTAAFVFAAQMLNFPVAAGTSGHLVGGILVAVLVGPGAAVIVMTAVLLLQCFLFQDGGASALGANIFNMAIVGTMGGYAVYAATRRLAGGLRGVVLGAAFAGWCSTVLAAVCCAGELALSGRVAWRVVLPAMSGIHMLIGLGEGIITALVLVAVARARPELLDARMETTQPRHVLALGLIAALGLALFVSPFACEWPDGFEKAAARLGFEHFASEKPLVAAPMPDYGLPGREGPWVTALVGAIGTVTAFVVAWVVARVLAAKVEGEAPAEPRGSGSTGGSPSRTAGS